MSIEEDFDTDNPKAVRVGSQIAVWRKHNEYVDIENDCSVGHYDGLRKAEGKTFIKLSRDGHEHEIELGEVEDYEVLAEQ